MRLLSYVIIRDYGFAPNPFYGYCTLATCKPRIRLSACIGDWVIGTGGVKYHRTGYLIYAMKVDEIMGFNSYWNDQRFFCKRPVLNGSLKQLYGDNIYHRHNNQWIQLNSHHSLDDNHPNERNITYDTGIDRLLISQKFVYYGSEAIQIPQDFRLFQPTNEDICCNGRGHRIKSNEITKAFEVWLNNIGKWGVQGMPIEFESHKRLI